MSTNKNYFDLIDSYLNGEMTRHEAMEFENQLRKDPLLENEFQLQKDIINSIKNFRQAELKATLNAVDVGVGGTITALKIAAGIGVIALLGIGIYYFTGEDTNKHQPDQISKNTPVTIEKDQPNEVTRKTETVVIPEKIDSRGPATSKAEEKPVSDPDKIAGQESQVSSKESTVSSPIETKKSEQPKIKLPEVVEEFDKQEEQISENIQIPENKLNRVTETYIPKTEVVEMDHRKYAFHYQFYNNKLYLYGKFDNKYEILELNTPEGISIYMFYKGNFYELQQNQEKITPLNAIQDSTLIKDLKTIREN